MEVTQRVGVRLLDAARLLVDKEIYLHSAIIKTERELGRAERALESTDLSPTIEEAHKRAKSAHNEALAVFNKHTSIMENEHHERMKLPELKRARKLLSQTWEICMERRIHIYIYIHIARGN